VRGANVFTTADTWPPAGVKYKAWRLSAIKTGSVTSLNDGMLAPKEEQGPEETSYSYPNPGWASGVVGFGPSGPAGGFDPVRRVLSFSTAPLEKDLEIAGPIKLVLYASSTAKDTDFVIKLSEQYPQSAEERAKGLNPSSQLVTKGWLRASHRALDPKRSTEMEPCHTHTDPQPLKPGEVYEFEISVEPNAYRFRQGNRIRLELVNGDSPITDVLWTHYYQPNKIGRDTIHHSARYPSRLILPVME
jgi:putative CocE/NonD family hydrolase